MWLWVLLGLAVLVILFYRPRENMSNDQLIDALKTFGEKGTPPSSKSSGQSNQAIYGPSASPPPVPTNTGGSGGGKTVAGPYPQIFGPDITSGLGTTAGSGSSGAPVGPGQVASDQGLAGGCQGPAEKTHEFNPDLAKAFPVDGPPQPFLTDFSKIQH